jgi:RNA polymerase sigma factor (sigma-70 family)
MDVSRDSIGDDGFRRRVEQMLEQEYASCSKKFFGWAAGWVKANAGKRLDEHELVDLYHDVIHIMLRKIALGTMTELTVTPCTFLIAIAKFYIPAWLRRRNRTDLPGELPREEGAELSPEDKTMLAELWEEIEALDEPGRTILYLTFKLGLSSKEIAEIMGYAGEDVVRQLRYRAMKELRFWHQVNQMEQPCRTLIVLSKKRRLSDEQIAQKMNLPNAEEARRLREECLKNIKK